MSNEHDRDQLTDRLLRRSMAAAAATFVPTPDCLDAETIAAWTDGGLDKTTAARAELHLSECANCQAMLAAFVSTEPAAGAAAEPAPPALAPFWQRWSRPWLVPLGAGVAAMLIWSVLRVETPGPVQTQMVQTDTPAPTVAPPSAFEPDVTRQAAPSGPPEAVAGADTSAANSALREARPAEVQPQAKAVEAPRVAGAAARNEAAAPARADRERPLMMDGIAAVTPDPPAAPPPPSPGPVAAPGAPGVPPAPPAAAAGAAQAAAQMDERTAVTAEAPLLTQSGERSFAAAEGNAQALPMARPNLALLSPGAVVVAEFSAAAQTPAMSVGRVGAGAGRGGGRGGAAAEAPASAAAAPTQGFAVQPVRWRIYGTGTVARSVDSAATWQPVTINPPAQIRAGSAPSALVCWFVGRGGVVLRSTDGLTFARIASPTTADLVAVVATSATSITMTAADGRTFATADGGATWR